MRYRYVPVTVLLEMRASGVRRPLEIIKADGARGGVTSSRYVGRRAAKSSGSGECWLCRVNGEIVPLYHSTFSGQWWIDEEEESGRALPDTADRSKR